MNGEGSRRPEIAPGHIDSLKQNSASSPAQQMPHLSHEISAENQNLYNSHMKQIRTDHLKRHT